MYSRFQIAKKYVDYYRHAENSRGHGIHSPFVFDFVLNVLNKRSHHPAFGTIEKFRKALLRNKQVIEVKDFGAGSAGKINGKRRSISAIASHSLKQPKYAKLLHRIAAHYHCENIIELGTSLGTTTAYLSTSSPTAHVTTLEGAPEIAAIATRFFKAHRFENIDLIEGDFSQTVTSIANQHEKIDLLFIDGNHREAPTVAYFDIFLKKAHNDSIFIFDDIHWSEEMETAWRKICDHPSVTMSIDLFFFGIVFFKKEFLVKQHFSLRY